MLEFLEKFWKGFLDILAICLDFVGKIPRAVFGDAIDSKIGTSAAIIVTLVLFAYVAALPRSISAYIAAKEVDFSQDEVDRYNLDRENGTDPHVIDWKKARRQQSRALWFSWPVSLLAITSMYYWVRFDTSFRGYVLMSLAWVLLYIVIRPWWVATKLRSDRNLVNSGLVESKAMSYYGWSTREALSHYFRWGLGKNKRKKRIFIKRLRKVEKVVRFLMLDWLRKRLIWPVLIIFAYAAMWFFTAPIAPFVLNHKFDKTKWLQPLWTSYDTPEPQYGPNPALRNTPGDEAAAAA